MAMSEVAEVAEVTFTAKSIVGLEVGCIVGLPVEHRWRGRESVVEAFKI